MPSSLIFAALAAAWLVVLVPMFARRRQEVSRTTDSALAARVVRRGGDRAPAEPGDAETDRAQEAYGMADTDRHDDDIEPDFDDVPDEQDEQGRPVNGDDVRAGRRYRPGRGGYDPEAAALAARTKYARRQRVLLLIVAAAVATALLAAFAWTAAWWLHGMIDLGIVGYLTYLRRQVRIEQDIRDRRLARMSESRDEPDADYRETYYDEPAEPAADDRYDYEPRRDDRRGSDAVVVEIDDEDPMFDELDERTWQPYRRAVGE
ncbi:MAG: hypothetical protein IJH84_03725 [Saccharopolyspora sp.]|uniref:divisome protein SepX/GlpR n=1 Tax=unclassified Saccharopolyspora TaxID=2646250 RepID=UPI0025D3FB53|nr:gephyrin-like molybdotransferase receptor GlpR [Saccharopolyspora sp.]MBQ6640126.1 hypothetical protein [Saccharopolyspora sp.]